MVTENGNRGIRHGLAVEEVDEGSRQPIGAKSRSLCEMGRCPSRPLHSSRASGTKTFILRYRPAGTGRDGPKRFLKIGRYGPLTPDEARRQAREILGQVASCKDPTADLAVGEATITVANLAARYLDGEVAPKRKPHTTALYVHYLNRFVIPKMGKIKADSVTRATVSKLHLGLGRSKRVTANRVLDTVSGMFRFGDRSGLLPPNRKIQGDGT